MGILSKVLSNKGGSNPNLIINGDFEIDQRQVGNSVTSALNNFYFRDRWRLNTYSRDNNFEKTPNGIKIFGGMIQYVELSPDNAGKEFTLSFDLKSNFAIKTAIGYSGITGGNKELDIEPSGEMKRHKFTVTLPEEYSQNNIYIRFYGVNEKPEFEINNVKFEEGRVATNFEKPNTTTELLKCQRYYYRKGRESDNFSGQTNIAVAGYSSFSSIDNIAILTIEFPVEMRSQPSVSFSAKTSATLSNTFYIKHRLGSSQSVDMNNIKTLAYFTNRIVLPLPPINSDLVSSSGTDEFWVVFGVNQYIEFDAEL